MIDDVIKVLYINFLYKPHIIDIEERVKVILDVYYGSDIFDDLMHNTYYKSNGDNVFDRICMDANEMWLKYTTTSKIIPIPRN